MFRIFETRELKRMSNFKKFVNEYVIRRKEVRF